eukprot:m.21763 g.21763  ORF g.21763 m.21763 type:complete len:163 (+) comp28215_c0_seq4:24-512(+)
MSATKDPEYGDAYNDSKEPRISHRDSVVVSQVAVQIRMGFLRKVYGILTAQLILTVIMATSFTTIGPIKAFVRGSPITLMVAAFATFGILIALLVKKNEHPTNLYLLTAFVSGFLEEVQCSEAILWFIRRSARRIRLALWLLFTTVLLSWRLFSLLWLSSLV